MGGFYLMPRGMLDHPAFGGKREPFCRRSAWVWLVENAAYQERVISVGGKAVTLSRGQLSVSVRHLARQWGWSAPRVFRYLTAVREHHLAECVGDTANTIITIGNYDEYRLETRSADTPIETAPKQQRDTTETHTKEVKKVRKEEEGSVPNGTAKAAPEGNGHDDLAAEIFTVGVRILTRRGVPDRQARAILGGHRKKLQDDGRLLALLASVERNNPIEPIGYLAKAVETASLNGERPFTFGVG